jgi:hypothetical protein
MVSPTTKEMAPMATINGVALIQGNIKFMFGTKFQYNVCNFSCDDIAQ